jgi:hypothetical protein
MERNILNHAPLIGGNFLLLKILKYDIINYKIKKGEIM